MADSNSISGSIPEGPLPIVGRFNSTGGSSTNSSLRLESFTEAVPLALSSMAHASLPLEDGVLDGLRQVLSHTLLSCVNYARIVHPPHQWTFRDLTTSPFAWAPIKSSSSIPARDLPMSLNRLKFQHQYSRNALIYLRPALAPNLTAEEELMKVVDWSQHVGVLGRVSLMYTSTEPLTAGEIDGTDVEDMPPTILYKILVEYRSLPATGNQQAVQAEELSMLSFGGSVDDDVKYGALAALYDTTAKYVLEIYSVRGKKYKFDLMDSTLSNGMVPQLPSSSVGDPFVKSLCVTVTDHNDVVPKVDKQYAVTRLQLIMEGKPRAKLDQLPPFDLLSESIKTSFLLFNPDPPPMATAVPSGHTLILDPAYAGRIYVNGRYVTTWGQDRRIGSHGNALFGMDLLSIPFWHGRIVDYEAMKEAYAQLWYEILVDARWIELNIARLLLFRIMTGQDPDNRAEGYDDDSYDNLVFDTSVECLESQILSSSQYDRVGLAPKALATRFTQEFGQHAFPCLAYEKERITELLPGRKPVEVPHRLISVLRRGGFFDVQTTANEMWFSGARASQVGEEQDIIEGSVQFLEESGCFDVSADRVLWVNFPVAAGVLGKKSVCRYSEVTEQFYVHETFLQKSVTEYVGGDFSFQENDGRHVDWIRTKAYLLGMYIAQAHPDGKYAAQYCLRNYNKH